MKPNIKNATEHLHFDSIGEVRSALEDDGGRLTRGAIEANEKSFGRRGYNQSEKQGGGHDWDLGAKWEGAMQMAGHEGWPKGGEKIRNLVEAMENFQPDVDELGESNQMGFRYDEEGEELNIEAYLDGDDQPWLQPVWNDTKPIVKILVNHSGSCAVSAKDLEARGSVMAAVATKLERLGFGVQIFIGQIGGNGPATRPCYTVKVKDSDEYLDENQLAFWVAHPAAFRRIGFRMIEAMHSDVGSGYGIPSEFKSDSFNFISCGAHLNRAKSEGWFGNPEKAANEAIRVATQIFDGLLDPSSHKDYAAEDGH